MGAQRQRLGALRLELPHQLGPEQPPGPELRHLHEEVHADRPEERQPRRERVDVQTGPEAGPQVLDAVGERVGQLEVGRGPGLLDVVAGDRDRVELRHPPGGEPEDVGDDPHRRGRRVDVGVADHELLEDVVLDGPGQLLARHPLLLGRDDVEGEHRQHGAVHGHGHAHPVERDPVEQLAHVVDRVDRDAGHPDVARHPRVIAVVAAVGRQVERDRQALLAGREVAPVERVGLLGGGEPGVLPDRPGLVHVHRRVRPAQVGRQAGVGGEEVEPVEVRPAVQRLHVDSLGGDPRPPAGLAAGRVPAARAVLAGRGQRVVPALLVVRTGGRRLGQLDVGEVGDLPVARHRATPSASSIRPQNASTSMSSMILSAAPGTGACGSPAATTTVDAPCARAVFTAARSSSAVASGPPQTMTTKPGEGPGRFGGDRRDAGRREQGAHPVDLGVGRPRGVQRRQRDRRRRPGGHRVDVRAVAKLLVPLRPADAG